MRATRALKTPGSWMGSLAHASRRRRPGESVGVVMRRVLCAVQGLESGYYVIVGSGLPWCGPATGLSLRGQWLMRRNRPFCRPGDLRFVGGVALLVLFALLGVVQYQAAKVRFTASTDLLAELAEATFIEEEDLP